MFDDPKKELKRLEEQLLLEEDDGWLETLAQANALLQEDDPDMDATRVFQPPVRNFANGYGTRAPAYSESYEEYDDFYTDEEPESPSPALREKGIGGLVVLALLEMAGIMGIVLYWLNMLL